MMGVVRGKAAMRILLGLFLTTLAVTASVASQDDTVSARVLTIDGRVAQGELSGIASTARLDASSLTNYVGPFQAFNIPRSKIRQIALDFPRMVVETDDRVFVGPFSAFSGISEMLVLHQGTKRIAIPTMSIRAIALHGYPFRPVPREWLGSTFLVMPLSTARASLTAPSEPERPFVPSTTVEAPEAGEEEAPAWLPLLIIGALIAFVLFSYSFGGS